MRDFRKKTEHYTQRSEKLDMRFESGALEP